MAFCGNCGKPAEPGSYCPYCGFRTEKEPLGNPAVRTKKNVGNRKKKKRWQICMAVIAVVVIVFVRMMVPSEVDEPCDYCRKSPSVKYRLSILNDSGRSAAYVCDRCSRRCLYCGDRATKHYESAAGMMVFTCSSCYRGLRDSTW